MLHALQNALAPAAMERLTLLFNHVLARETAATQRLRPHAGRTMAVRLEQWPGWLPPWPPLAFRITPAGLLEWCGQEGAGAPDLTIHLDASNPARLAFDAAAGRAPTLRIDGDAQLAADVNWLVGNVRWDLADDLQRQFGPAAAQALAQAGSMFKQGLKAAMQAVQSLADRARPPSP